MGRLFSPLLQCLLLSVAVFLVELSAAGPVLVKSAERRESRAIPATRPLVIAHRGASGVLPEHTAEAYRRAVQDNADYVECDVRITADLVPVCLHENALNLTTDVKDHPEFADRMTTLTYINYVGQEQTETDWFATNFTLAELKTLRRVQPMPFRDQSFNGLYAIPTLQECIDVVKAANRSVGIYPEIKDPVFTNSALFNESGHGFEDAVLAVLARNNYTTAADLCLLQSFNDSSLDYLRSRTALRLVMLIEYDVSDATLDSWSQRFYGIGAWTNVVAEHWTPANGYKHWINKTTDFVRRAHDRQLQVHLWTLRNEDRYLAWDFEQDVNMAYELFLTKHAADGLFTDFPQSLNAYLDRLHPPPPVSPPTQQPPVPCVNRAWAVNSLSAAVVCYLIAVTSITVTSVQRHCIF